MINVKSTTRWLFSYGVIWFRFSDILSRCCKINNYFNCLTCCHLHFPLIAFFNVQQWIAIFAGQIIWNRQDVGLSCKMLDAWTAKLSFLPLFSFTLKKLSAFLHSLKKKWLILKRLLSYFSFFLLNWLKLNAILLPFLKCKYYFSLNFKKLFPFFP